MVEAIDVLKVEVDKELQRNFGLWLRKVLEKRKIYLDIDFETMTGRLLSCLGNNAIIKGVAL